MSKKEKLTPEDHLLASVTLTFSIILSVIAGLEYWAWWKSRHGDITLLEERIYLLKKDSTEFYCNADVCNEITYRRLEE